MLHIKLKKFTLPLCVCVVSLFLAPTIVSAATETGPVAASKAADQKAALAKKAADRQAKKEKEAKEKEVEQETEDATQTQQVPAEKEQEK